MNARGAREAFESHDWSHELDLMRELAGKNDEYCPPGIGFVVAPGHLLHICPATDTALIHYHFVESDRLLGLFPRRRSLVHSKVEFPLSDVSDLIGLLFIGDHQGLLIRLEATAA